MRQKVSRALKGRKRSVKTRAKISQTMRQQSVARRVLAAVEKVLRQHSDGDTPDDRLHLTGLFQAAGEQRGSPQSTDFEYSAKLREYRRSESSCHVHHAYVATTALTRLSECCPSKLMKLAN
jgi:hypothetical protein